MPRGIYQRKPCLERTKRKIGLANKGHPVLVETRAKIREKLKGRSLPMWWKNKISQGLKGRPVSSATRKKIAESLMGEKSYLWKGGILIENQKVRRGIEYRLWREAVFARDNWTCQKCRVRKERNLVAHHIQNFAQYIELRTSIENGINFCNECHVKFHKKYGNKNNTKAEIEKFLNY